MNGIDKLEAAKCYIKEVNNNREDKVKAVPKCALNVTIFGRLEEMFQQTDAEQGDEEDGEMLVQNQANIIQDGNIERCEETKTNIKTGSYQIKKIKLKSFYVL